MTPKTLRLAHRLALALTAMALAACGTTDDPVAEVPNPPNPPTTTGKAAQNPGGDDDGGKSGDDDGGGGGGGGHNGGGGGGGDDSSDDSSDGGGGNGSSSNGDQGGPVKVNGPKVTLTVTADPSGELLFEPSGLQAPPGHITLVMKNPSDEEHGIAIAGDNVKEESKEVGKGEEAKVTVDLPPGQYEFYCPVGDHREKGMSGILTIGKLPPGVR